jgi:hypothetical protein
LLQVLPMMKGIAISSLALSLFAACGTNGSGDGDEDGGGYGSGLGTPENPIPQSADKGPYAVRTLMDFTVEQVLPPQAELVVVTLRAFGTNPARTLITVADHYGVPALDTLYGVLPGYLTDKFEGWVNDEINKFRIAGKTVPQYSAAVARLAETALTKFAIESDFAITPTSSTHTLTGLDLSPAGIDVHVAITGLAADILTQHPTITVAPGGAFSVSEQHFGLMIGEYAWQGVNAGVTNLFGNDIRTSLGKAVNCNTIASNIADKCVLGVCVGHETLIKDICTGSLDAMVNEIHSRFAKLNMEAFHMISGDARLVDDDSDGIADRIVEGKWDSELNWGIGLRKAPAVFEATR